MVQACITMLLTNRSNLYAFPDLAHVSGNGGDRINKKLQQMLRMLERSVDKGHGMTAAAVAALKGTGGDSQRKAKKRKVKTVQDNEVDQQL